MPCLSGIESLRCSDCNLGYILLEVMDQYQLLLEHVKNILISTEGASAEVAFETASDASINRDLCRQPESDKSHYAHRALSRLHLEDEVENERVSIYIIRPMHEIREPENNEDHEEELTFYSPQPWAVAQQEPQPDVVKDWEFVDLEVDSEIDEIFLPAMPVVPA